jgi:antitoxin component of MazEF toxin-antitoxin module
MAGATRKTRNGAKSIEGPVVVEVIATRKADNRARIVLPKEFANQTVVIEQLGPNELRLRKKPTLSHMLAAITPENVHAEVDFGSPVGRERL